MLYKAVVLEASTAISAAVLRLRIYPGDAYVAIKHRVGANIYWHLFQVEDIRAIGKSVSGAKGGTNRPLENVLELHADLGVEVHGTAVLDSPDVGSTEGIVLEEGRVIGVLRADSPAYRAGVERSSQEIAARAARYLDATVEQLIPGGKDPVVRQMDFARGGEHRVSVSIVTRDTATGFLADIPLPLDPETPHQLEISFMAAWLPPTDPQPLSLLDRNPRPVQVTFKLPYWVEKVALTVTVHEIVKEKRKIVQTAVLLGDAVEPGQSGSGIRLRIDRRLRHPAESPPADVSLVLADDALAVFDGIRFTPPAFMMKLRAHLGDKTLNLWSEIDGISQDRSLTDTILGGALLKLAARGRELYQMLDERFTGTKALKERFLNGRGGIKIVSRDLDMDLPLEFVYDGPRPNLSKPELCESFLEGLKASRCQECPNRSNEICAFDFWGLRRRIERRVIDRDDFSQKHSLDQPIVVDERTSYFSPALLAASSKVTSTSLTSVVDAIRVFDPSMKQPMANWDEWVKVLATERQYRLLVLLAHKEGDADPALEIGGTYLDRAWFTKSYVNPCEKVPGPLVLLTGCETARAEYAPLSFIATFLSQGAAAVVGTIAQVREDESARVTENILHAIRDVLASDMPEQDRSIGEVIRRARCQLLAQQDLTGLNLVAYGETGWQLGVESKDETTAH